MEERWAQYWANRYSWVLNRRHDLDMDDLLQAARIGGFIAEMTYKPEMGAWTTYSAYYITNELRRAAGIDGGEMPPEAISLDEPIYADGETTRGDQLEDENAPDPDTEIYEDQCRRCLHHAVAGLPSRPLQAVAWLHCVKGKTAPQIAQDLKTTVQTVRRLLKRARILMQRDRLVRLFLDIERTTPYYAKVTITQFHRTNTSAVELAVMHRERSRTRLRRALDAQEEHCQQDENMV